ncbi:MAG: type II toxin-antitoxin system Phd/YefM family antitoxin [Dehalococcoidia bacterium]|nr:MAG: type II toxin-antitoxin system Phd/YefM family antitoxin [bacterium]MCE7927771.1 type II toxin-antitoxin system Phd/YefM family antitoxin [Chloroflexi bacterium CFX7]MCL4230555.1 type II toxin-antitoxin system prevent-host-death family antitoxin [Dehalococcoidia bacterium]NUQ55768.1 type II toxin-antitoxin system Phd/YefM family antitoxin [Dehalococcoidia bacterium]
MKTISAAEFRAKCLTMLDAVDPEGILITKRGKPVARLVPVVGRGDHRHLIGIMRGEIVVDESDDLFETGAWGSDEWGERDGGPSGAGA